MVVVQNISPHFGYLPNQIIASTNIKCVSRASLHASWLAVLISTVCAQVALDSMVTNGIVSDCTIGTGHNTFAASSATGLINLHHPGLLVL